MLDEPNTVGVMYTYVNIRIYICSMIGSCTQRLVGIYMWYLNLMSTRTSSIKAFKASSSEKKKRFPKTTQIRYPLRPQLSIPKKRLLNTT